MAFEKFTATGKSFKPKASISQRGMLSFSQGARQRYGMDNYKYGVLYYDKDEQKIGLELTNDQDAEGATKIRFRQTGADLGVKSFINFYNIGGENTTMYDVVQGENENWIIIELKTARERKPGDKEIDSA